MFSELGFKTNSYFLNYLIYKQMHYNSDLTSHIQRSVRYVFSLHGIISIQFKLGHFDFGMNMLAHELVPLGLKWL